MTVSVRIGVFALWFWPGPSWSTSAPPAVVCLQGEGEGGCEAEQDGSCPRARPHAAPVRSGAVVSFHPELITLWSTSKRIDCNYSTFYSIFSCQALAYTQRRACIKYFSWEFLPLEIELLSVAIVCYKNAWKPQVRCGLPCSIGFTHLIKLNLACVELAA